MNRYLDRISPFIVMDILARARTLPDAVHMEVGEPDIPVSGRVREAYEKAIRDNRFYYTPAKGLPELRERIADYYLNKYRVSLSPERILITPGTSGAFLIAFSLLVDSERRLVLSDPSYPCYRNFAYFLGSEPVFIPVDRSGSYEIKPEQVSPLSGIGALVISSPANPMGNMYGDETLRGLISLCDEKGWRFISDEIYHGLVYDRKEHTALEFSDRAVVINGFSKYFCMPGFRVGWMILPDELVRKAEIISQNIFIAANTPAQYAALEAFDEEYLETVRSTFRRRRDFLFSELKSMFDVDAAPDGAFYLWADISRYSADAMAFCTRLLDERAVAVTPGVDFGKNGTEHHVRFAYTQGVERLAEGVRRIREFLADPGDL